MRGPALAVVGSDGRLERSTAAFTSLGDAGALIDGHPEELERVLRGEAASAVLTVGAVTAAIEAVVDESGGRHALLTVRESEDETDASACANPLLDEDLDSSPAIVFLKDLEGRYLRINSRHGQLVGGGEEKLLGKTDRELDAKLTVDGPRLKERDPADPEPQQLEYIVPAYEKRPALSVLRFLVHDRAGQPVALCGVAAPLNESELARTEAERLMDVERYAHVDPSTARAELLSRWGLAGGAAVSTTVIRADAEVVAGQIADLTADEQALARALAEEQQRAEDLERALEEATRQLNASSLSPDDQIEDAQLRVEQARVQAEQAHAESEHLKAELELARAETEQARAIARREHEDAESARTATQAARAEASQALLKIEQLDADSIQLRSRFEQAEAEARDSRVRAEKADVEAVEARARADQAEIEIRQARTRVEQAEADVRQARARAEQAEADARQAKSRVEQADGDVRQARARAEEAETEALRASRRAEEAETGLRQAKAEIEELEAARRQARGQIDELESAAARARAAIDEAERSGREWRLRAEQAESELTAARAAAATDTKGSGEVADRDAGEWAAVREKLGAADSQTGELRETLAAERARTEELRRLLEQAQERAVSLGVELAAVQAADAARQEAAAEAAAEEAARVEAEAAEAARLEAEAAAAETARLEAEAAVAETARLEAAEADARAAGGARRPGTGQAADAEPVTGVQWGARAQRQLAAALGDADELRHGLTAAVNVLGVRGGWDLVAAWTPDQRGILRCTASWSREPLGELERLSHGVGHAVGSRLGAALYAREPVWIENVAQAPAPAIAPEDDGPDRLSEAGGAGVRTALLLPIREGVARIGVLELLARTQTASDPELVSALEAVGLQLGQFAALMRARRIAPGGR